MRKDGVSRMRLRTLKVEGEFGRKQDSFSSSLGVGCDLEGQEEGRPAFRLTRGQVVVYRCTRVEELVTVTWVYAKDERRVVS